jgi:hypothetical protein
MLSCFSKAIWNGTLMLISTNVVFVINNLTAFAENYLYY